MRRTTSDRGIDRGERGACRRGASADENILNLLLSCGVTVPPEARLADEGERRLLEARLGHWRAISRELAQPPVVAAALRVSRVSQPGESAE